MSFSARSAVSSSANSSDQSVKVMVVDDSAVVRGLVSRWIEEEDGLELVARHANGKLAVEDVARSAPNVIVLDIEMPVMDGLTALPLLRKGCPSAKVVMSSTLTRRNAEVSMKALSLGATDYVAKPETNRGVTTSMEFRRELLEKIKAIGGARVSAAPGAAAGGGRKAFSIPKQRPKMSSARPAAAAKTGGSGLVQRKFSSVRPRILAIGSSTGGPQALIEVLKKVSPALGGIPTVITQHMPATFTTILAEHIGQATGRKAKEGDNAEPLTPGNIYVAPGGKHMVLESSAGNTSIRLDDGPQVNFCKPAVDPLFDSVAKIYGSAALGVVLTGMGHDGAEGSTNIANAGGSIIAQDEETSVVWGMPGATAAAGACAAVLPLSDIGMKVTSILKGTGV